MKMLTLPSGKIINPAHVKGVSAHRHLINRASLYVQLDMKRGAHEVIAEKVTPEAAEEMKATYLRLVEAAYEDVGAYSIGYDDGHTEGHESGRAAGYEQGSNDGYSRGRQDALASAHESTRAHVVQELSDMRDELLRKQIDAHASGPAQRRYIRNSISLLTDLIRRFSPPSQDGGQ
jgi:hypothetical protein